MMAAAPAPQSAQPGAGHPLLFRLAAQLTRNAAAVLARGAMQMGYWMVVTPLVLHRLGASAFGLWSLIYVISAYVMLLDLGISGATSKFLSEVDPEVHAEACRRSLSTGLIGLLPLMLAGAGATWLAYSKGMGVSAAAIHVASAGALLLTVWLLFASALAANLLNMALCGLQRQDLAAGLNAAIVLASAVATWAVLDLGWGLTAVIAVGVAANLAMIVAYGRALGRRLQGRLWGRPQPGAFARLLRFSIWLQVFAVVGLFDFLAGKAWIAASMTLTAVGTYEIGLRLATLLRQGVTTITGSLMPASSRVFGELGPAATARMFELTMLLGSYVATPMYAALALWAAPVIALWVGPGHAQSALVLRLLIPGFYLATFATLTWFFLVGVGSPRSGALFSLVQSGIGLALMVWWSRTWGVAGVAAAVSVPAALTCIGYLWLLRRELPISLIRVIGRCLLLPLALCGGVAGLCALLMPAADSLWRLAGSGGLLVVLCYAALFLSPALGRQERQWLRRALAHAPAKHFA